MPPSLKQHPVREKDGFIFYAGKWRSPDGFARQREYINFQARERWRLLGKPRKQKWLSENPFCIDCGSDGVRVADHIDPTSKMYEIAGIWSYPEPILLAELAKCQPLCRPCHGRKIHRDLKAGLRSPKRQKRQASKYYLK